MYFHCPLTVHICSVHYASVKDIVKIKGKPAIFTVNIFAMQSWIVNIGTECFVQHLNLPSASIQQCLPVSELRWSSFARQQILVYFHIQLGPQKILVH